MPVKVVDPWGVWTVMAFGPGAISKGTWKLICCTPFWLAMAKIGAVPGAIPGATLMMTE